MQREEIVNWKSEQQQCQRNGILYEIQVLGTVFRYVGTAAPLNSSLKSTLSLLFYLLICHAALILFVLSPSFRLNESVSANARHHSDSASLKEGWAANVSLCKRQRGARGLLRYWQARSLFICHDLVVHNIIWLCVVPRAATESLRAFCAVRNLQHERSGLVENILPLPLP